MKIVSIKTASGARGPERYSSAYSTPFALRIADFTHTLRARTCSFPGWCRGAAVRSAANLAQQVPGVDEVLRRRSVYSGNLHRPGRVRPSRVTVRATACLLGRLQWSVSVPFTGCCRCRCCTKLARCWRFSRDESVFALSTYLSA